MLRADTGESYYPGAPHGEASYSSASQTAWALLALMAAGEVDNPSVARGVAYLIATQDRDGNWDEPWYTAVGFPRVFYLRYHGYRAFFRYGRWRAIAACRSPIPGASRSGCDSAGAAAWLAHDSARGRRNIALHESPVIDPVAVPAQPLDTLIRIDPHSGGAFGRDRR